MTPSLGCPTVVDAVFRNADRAPDAPAYVFTDRGARTRRNRDALATRIAAWSHALERRGVRPQDRVAIFFSAGPDFIEAFLGCLHLGAIAVPVGAPRRENERLRARSILKDCDATLSLLAPGLSFDPGTAVMHAPDADFAAASGPRCSPDDVAFLQYTSGSTGTPKGVVIRHDALMANQRHIFTAFGHRPDHHILSWLPLYHDMGLIGTLLQPLAAGLDATLMPPEQFLRRPMSWLAEISGLQGVTSGGPDFAYRLCVERARDEDAERLDLSGWRVAFSGAEPVRAETLRRFAEVFVPCGFDMRAFLPCYGQAEATLYICGGVTDRAPRVLQADRAALGRDRLVEAEPDADGAAFVDCGPAHPEIPLAVVDPDSGRRLAEGRIGEIWALSAAAGSRYFRRADQALRATLDGDGGWLRTGDLGALVDGGIYIVGRLRDLIMLRGRNYQAQDLEESAAGLHPALRPGRGIATAVVRDGIEAAALVWEVASRTDADRRAEIAERIRAEMDRVHGLTSVEVVLLPPGALPRTPNGKLRRAACRTALEAGTWDDLSLPAPARSDRLTAVLHGVEAWVNGAEAADLTLDTLDSLARLELAARIEETLGFQVPAGLALTAETAAQLAAGLAPPPDEPRTARARSASAAERALWLQTLAEGDRALWLTAAADLDLPWDADLHTRLQDLARSLARAYPQLGDRFEESHGEILRLPSPDFTAVPLDLSGCGGRLPPPGEGPLIRMWAHRSGTGCRLGVETHHILLDGQGLAFLWTAILAELTGYPPPVVGAAAPPVEPGPGPAPRPAGWPAPPVLIPEPDCATDPVPPEVAAEAFDPRLLDAEAGPSYRKRTARMLAAVGRTAMRWVGTDEIVLALAFSDRSPHPRDQAPNCRVRMLPVILRDLGEDRPEAIRLAEQALDDAFARGPNWPENAREYQVLQVDIRQGGEHHALADWTIAAEAGEWRAYRGLRYHPLPLHPRAPQAWLAWTLDISADRGLLTVEADRRRVSAGTLRSLLRETRAALTDAPPPVPAGVPRAAPVRLPDHPVPAGLRCDGAVTLSPEALQERVEALRRVLSREGWPCGTVVACEAPRGIEAVTFLLAALSADLTALFVSAEDGPARRDRALDLSDAAACLRPLGSGWQVAALRSAAAPHPPGICFMTSGTTGLGSVVLQGRPAILGYVRRIAAAYGLTVADRVLAFAQPGFDVFLEEVLPTAFAGATLVLPPQQGLIPIAGLLDCLRSQRVTVANLPSSYARRLAKALARDGRRLPDTLRCLIVGSEPLPPDMPELWRRIAPPRAKLIDAYGLTEAVVTSALAENPTRTGILGKPLADTRFLLLDRNGRTVPDGFAGELHIAGPCLAEGYLGEPERTAERFCFADGERRLATGDLARRLSDDRLQLLGRKDAQLKFNGRRISAEEIEAVLCRSPSVAQVMAGELDGALAALIVPEGALDWADLSARLEENLPHWMRPTRFAEIAELPTGPSGTLLRGRFPVLAAGASSLQGKASAPAEVPDSPYAAAVARMWHEVLQPDDSGLSFLAAGGESLKALTLVHALAREGIAVELTDVLPDCTLGRVIAAARALNPADVSLPESMPPTALQAELLARNDEARRIYDHEGVLCLGPDVPAKALSEALLALCEAHPALRYRVEGQRLEFVAAREAMCLWWCSDEDDTDPVARARREMGRLRRWRRPDLAPMLLASAVARPDRVVLVLSVHHLSIDAASWAVLLDDLEAALGGRPVQRTTADWLHAMEARLLSALVWSPADAAERWRTHLDGAIGASALDAAANETVERRVAAPPRLRIDALQSRALRILGKALSHRIGADRLQMDLESHGRSSGRRVVGWFTREVPRVYDARRDMALPPPDGGASAEAWNGGADLPRGLVRLNIVGDTKPALPLARPPRLVAAGETSAHPVQADILVHEESLLIRIAAAADGLADALADALVDGLSWLDVSDAAPPHPADGPVGAPATPVQASLYFHDRLRPETEVGIEHTTIALRGHPDTGALERAVAWIVARHGALRSVVLPAIDPPVLQAVHPDAQPRLRIVDLTGTAPDDTEALRADLIATTRAAAAALRVPPLLEVVLVLWPDGRSELILAHPHTILDGYSMNVLRDELDRAYAAFAAGQTPDIAPAPDYARLCHAAAWTDLPAARAYWRDALANLPTARDALAPRPESAGGQHDHVLPDALRHALSDRARAHGVTRATLIQAAWALTLSERSGARDVCFGMTTSGRPTEIDGAERVLGCFMNTLPRRFRLGARPDPPLLVQAVQAQQEAARRHERVGLNQVRAVSDVQRRDGLTDLYQTALVIEDHVGALERFLGQPVCGIDYGARLDYPAVAHVFSETGRLRVFVGAGYGTETTAEALAADFVQQLVRLCDGLTASPRAGPWIEGPALPPGPDVILDRIARQPERTVAIEEAGQNTSYAALRTRAGAWAATIEAAGFAGRRIALPARLTTGAVEALLGVLWAGSSYVPLNELDTGAERLAAIVRHLDIAAVLLHDGCDPGPWVAAGLPILEAPTSISPEIPHRAAADAEAYVICSSGTTGTPKAISIPHRALAASTRARDTAFAAPPGRYLLISALTFDASVCGLFWTLSKGGTLVLPGMEPRLFSERIPETLVRSRITHVSLTPRLADALAARLSLPEELGTVIVAGEALPRGVLTRLAERLPGVDIHNEYGPTEATVWCTTCRVDPSDESVIAPLGHPIAGARLMILDENRRPVPPGQPGELAVAGAALGDGYAGAPDLTSARFVAVPEGADGTRAFLTGDFVVQQVDGNLAFLGRLDDQLKISGVRVEPGEVAHLLLESANVCEAAAVALDASRGGPAILGAVRLVESARPGWEEALRRELQAKAPPWLAPRHLVAVDGPLPRTAHGKLDRAALLARWRAETDRTDPATPVWTGDWLARAWMQVFALETAPGETANLFALGGDSLGLIRLHTYLMTTRGKAPSLAALFANPTLGAMRRLIDEAPASENDPIRLDRASDRLPLTEAQSGIVLAAQLSDTPSAFHVPIALAFSSVAPETVRDALLGVMRRHDILHAGIAETDGLIALRLSKTVPTVSVETTLGHLTPQAAAEILRERLDSPFDLSQGPLWRAALAPLDRGGVVLVLVFHQVVADGASLDLFIADLERALRGDLPAPDDIQAPDIAAWEARRAPAAQARSYWKRVLTDLPETLDLLAADAATDARGAASRARHMFSAEEGARLRDRAQSVDCSLASLFCASWAETLAALAPGDGIVLGLPVVGRTAPGAERALGFFARTLPLVWHRRANTDGPSAVRMQERIAEALAHQDIAVEPFLRLERPGIDALFDALFVFENAHRGDTLALGATPIDLRNPTARLYTTLRVDDDATGLTAAIDAPAHRVGAGAAQALLEAWLQRLRAAPAPAAAPDIRKEPGLCGSLLFERCRRTWLTRPGVVLHDEAGAVPASDIGARVEAMADRLSAAGIGAGAVVALCEPPGRDWLTGLLALWALGAVPAFGESEAPAPEQRAGAEALQATALLLQGRIEPLAPADPADARHGAWIVATTGSSGSPKPVLVSTANAIAYTDAIQARLRIQGPTSCASPGDPAADLHLTAVLIALMSGGDLALPARRIARDPEGFGGFMARTRPALLKITPSHLAALAANIGLRAALPGRLLVLGGESPSRELLQGIAATAPDLEVWNHYGPAECTVGVAAGCADPARPACIGTPLDGTDITILDRNREPVPQGFAGELRVGGRQVARYLTDAAAPSAYATRDRAWRLPDGRIEFLGRIDREVKHLGRRLHLDRLAERAGALPGIVGAAADVREGQLVLWIVPQTPHETDLTRRLRAKLNRHEQPAHIIELDEIPLAANGKPNLKALRMPGPATATHDAWSETENRLAIICAEILAGTVEDRHADFFRLGGNSLNLLQILARIRKEIEPGFTLRDLFETLTVAGAAERIEALQMARMAEAHAMVAGMTDEEVAETLRQLEQEA